MCVCVCLCIVYMHAHMHMKCCNETFFFAKLLWIASRFAINCTLWHDHNWKQQSRRLRAYILDRVTTVISPILNVLRFHPTTCLHFVVILVLWTWEYVSSLISTSRSRTDFGSGIVIPPRPEYSVSLFFQFWALVAHDLGFFSMKLRIIVLIPFAKLHPTAVGMQLHCCFPFSARLPYRLCG